MEVFYQHLNDCITARDKENYITNVPDCNWLSIDENDPKFDEEFKKVIINDGVSEANDNNVVDMPEMFDSYINMEVGLPRVNDVELYHATLKWRAINYDSKALVIEISNPITDTSLYEVEYLDELV